MKPKIRYKMEVFSNGDNQEQIITLLSKHNAGECEFTLDDLSTYLKMRNYLFSIVCNTTMQIMDDGIYPLSQLHGQMLHESYP